MNNRSKEGDVSATDYEQLTRLGRMQIRHGRAHPPSNNTACFTENFQHQLSARQEKWRPYSGKSIAHNLGKPTPGVNFAGMMAILNHPIAADHDVLHKLIGTAEEPARQNFIAFQMGKQRMCAVQDDKIRPLPGMDLTDGLTQGLSATSDTGIV
jgi:hypothetical protein